MEDQMGDFPRGGGWSLGVMNIKRISPGRSEPRLSSRGVNKFTQIRFPNSLSTDEVDNNPIQIYFQPKNNYI